MKLTEDEYCKHFKISKELLSSKIRAKKVVCVIENDTTYILASDNSIYKGSNNILETSKDIVLTNNHASTHKAKVTVATVLALYHKENAILKRKIVQLEGKVDRLIDEKEQILKDELNKLENFYSAKDRQLKNILELVNDKMISSDKELTIHDVESYSTFSDDSGESRHKLIELKEYLKSLGLKSTKRKTIKKKFLNLQNSDIRIITQDGELYLDFSRYDYSDLLA
ncbi:hypothetical protein [Sulfurimonas sp.]|uniref:hypothetical protein n=1 Tax=Sulfurimonas sp. TaxID=2022749 RepID=UPI0025FF3208|nr:hypothetical protein [Sulfurimonas sp.]MDD5158323.1 hypothetical protein [Sulfurimonas sp.]